MGGRIALRGFCGTGALVGIDGPVMSEFVMDAIRCSGEADTFKSSPLLLLTAIEVIGVTRLLIGVDELRLLRDVGVVIPGGGREAKDDAFTGDGGKEEGRSEGREGREGRVKLG
ncbi:hypothetical protein E2C01_059719 [Portunus trituberculatus]|uniref:Uncharacterized protein n=1 Tax=Portunus trituberculatus TaxID=210409 RepID=A0A5B7GZ61_PORTR|nr:hypothetical protein [Portunus trituberculatus]